MGSGESNSDFFDPIPHSPFPTPHLRSGYLSSLADIVKSFSKINIGVFETPQSGPSGGAGAESLTPAPSTLSPSHV